jgi:4-amino-4-deoxy-L-arabinose transferase-like glycosyltransferase
LKKETVGLVAVVVIGAALRVRGLDWGLPWALHIDERLFVVAKTLRMEYGLSEGGWPDPGITSYGIVPLWLLMIARKLFLGVVSGAGPPAYGDEFAGTVLLARWISAIWGTVTILWVGWWARRWGSLTGIVAAALVAGFPALVQASHFGTVEAPLVAILAAGMLAAERLAERPGTPRALTGGLLLGLAVSVKAPGAILMLPLAHAARGDGGRPWVTRVATIAVTAVVVAVALNPSLARGPDPETRAGEHTTLGGNLRRAYSSDFHDWTLPYMNDVPVWTELTSVLPHAIGVGPELLALAGLALFVRRRARRDVRLLLWLVPILLLVLPARVKTVRFLLPALPALAVLAAEAVRVLGERFPAWRAPIGAGAAVVTLLHGLAFSAVYAETDSRVAAARWLDENVGEREIVVMEDPPGYGPPAGSPSPGLVRPPLRYEFLWRGPRGFYDYEKSDDAAREAQLDRVLDRADWLALSEGHRVEFTVAGEARPVESSFYADLDSGRLPFRKVQEFKSYPRLGPLLLKDDGAEVLMRVFDHPRVEIWRRVEDDEP